jgi:uncharacterized membrane protein
MGKITINRILKHFLQGLLLVVPLALTWSVLVLSIQWMDGLVPVKIPGLGLLIILVAITFVGYLGSLFITKPIIEWMERGIARVPLISLIYISLKDLMGAFVGDKKKFNKPVLVALNQERSLYKMGFITETDLSILGLPGMVSVYLPHSYNFSGNHFLVSREMVTPLDISGTAAMKFIVSGGVSGIVEEE